MTASPIAPTTNRTKPAASAGLKMPAALILAGVAAVLIGLAAPANAAPAAKGPQAKHHAVKHQDFSSRHRHWHRHRHWRPHVRTCRTVWRHHRRVVICR